MYVKTLTFKKFRGFSYQINFQPSINYMVGTNGSGKSTIVDTIAALSGTDDATYLLQNEKFDLIKIVLCDNDSEFSLEINEPDIQKILDFKKTLPKRTSLVLSHNITDDRFVTDRAPPDFCIDHVRRFLQYSDMTLEKQLWFKPGSHATLNVSETGAQRYLLTVACRLSLESPMLIEHPERHLHPNIAEVIVREFYSSNDQQLIVTTHSPSIVARKAYSIDNYIDLDAEREDAERERLKANA